MASLIWPFVFFALGIAYILPNLTLHWWRWCGFFLLSVCFMMFASSIDLSFGDLVGGGMVGNTLYLNAKKYLSPFGSFLVWIFIFLAGTQLSINFSWINLVNNIHKWIKRILEKRLHKNNEASSTLSALSGLAERFRMPDFKSVLNLSSNIMSKMKQLAAQYAPPPVKNTPVELPEYTQQVPEDEAFALSEIISNDNNTRKINTNVEIISSIPDGTIDEFPIEMQEAEKFIEDQYEEGIRLIDGEGSSSSSGKILSDTTVYSDSTFDDTQKAENVRKFTPEEVPLPDSSLLNLSTQSKTVSMEDLQTRGLALMECFNNFGISGNLVGITPGPVVTMYEVRPAAGTRISKIANLSDELSLALKAMAVRILAPIPGTDTVGIEIPNETREIVNFRELIETEDFIQGCGPLTMALGKDISGKPFMADLAKMPHLLVAGSTGAGKSVCLNSIIASFLYRLQPEQMQLMLIDPKRVEMSVYADLPHLIHPVVTDMNEAKNALDWAVHEMERRYNTIKILNARNITAYNQKLANIDKSLHTEYAELEPFPYLVIIVDEFADLIMTAARDVEASIQRLGQVGRAAGVNMILATQRPSVDVVTSLIKTNMGGRISFQVPTKYDSRTILDQGGAEHLLGKGDMLYKQSGGALKRLHGPFLSDEEVQNIVSHWKKYREPSYNIDFSNWNSGKTSSRGNSENGNDPLYDAAKSFIMEQGRASISLLQRKFNIGYNRAARLMEKYEQEGIIGSANGSKPRQVIR